MIIAAGALHLNPDDLKTCTRSVLVDTMLQASLFAHIPMNKSIAEDYIAYRQVIRQIEDRATEESKKESM